MHTTDRPDDRFDSETAEVHGELRASTRATAIHLGTDGIELPRGRDPMMLDPRAVERVRARVGKRVVFDGGVADGAGETLAAMAKHGRRLHVTCWLVDGTKRIYRGNGQRIR